MMAIALAVVSMFASFDQLGSQFQAFIYQYFVPAAGQEVREYLNQFTQQTGRLTAVGLGFFLLTAVLLLTSIEQSFNDIWRIERGRVLTSRLTVYWALMTLGPLLMGASLSLSTYFLSLDAFGDYELLGQLRSLGVLMLPFTLQILAFCLLYLIMPKSAV